jgi:hypothetical protein
MSIDDKLNLFYVFPFQIKIQDRIFYYLGIFSLLLLLLLCVECEKYTKCNFIDFNFFFALLSAFSILVPLAYTVFCRPGMLGLYV